MSDKQTPLEQDPAVYLRQQPSPTSPCHILVEQVGSHDGDHVPMHMLAKVAVRLHQFADWVARWDGREKLARRVVAIVVGAAVANMAAIGTSWVHAHDARVTAAADAAAADRAFHEYRRETDDKIEQLRLDIRELRAQLRRMSGLQPDAGGPGAPDMAPLQIPPDVVASDARHLGAPTLRSVSSGIVCLHVPKLQYLQLGTRLVHSTLELQILPHDPLGTNEGGPQASIPMQMSNKTRLDMDMLYPWLHQVSTSKGPAL